MLADCAPLDAPGARRKTHRLRAGTRRVRAARRAACAPQDAQVARRKTRQLRAARRVDRARSFFSVKAGGVSKLLAGGVGEWLTERPSQAAWGEKRPPTLCQHRSVAPLT